MSPRTCFPVFFAAGLALLGCSKRDDSVQNIDALVGQFEAHGFDASAKPESLRMRLGFNGTVILASPHSVSGSQSNLTANVGASVAQKLLDKTGLSESFFVFLVTDSGKVNCLRWDRPTFVFSDLFIVKCQQGDYLVLDIQDKTLKGIRAERE